MDEDLTVKIKIIDNICAEVISGKKIIQPLLSFESEYWVQGQYRKQKKVYQKSLMFGKGNKFIYNGWIDRIRDFCKRQDIPFSCEGEVEEFKPTKKPRLKGIAPREYQVKAVNSIIEKQRGTVCLATGLGKTITACLLISAYPKARVLILCHNLSLVNQFSNELKRFNIPTTVYSKENKKVGPRVTVTNLQIFKKADLVNLSDYFDILCSDEGHIASRQGSAIEIICSKILAPIRFLLSATIPDDIEKSLIIEGLFGPKLIDMAAKAGVEEEFLSRPIIKIVAVPLPKGLSKLGTYREVYKHGIVENIYRNNLICKEITNVLSQNQTILTFCVEIAHIKNISNILKLKDIDHEIVFGNTPDEDREKIKKNLESGKVKCVISSVVWREGISVSSLSAVLLAGAGKSSTSLLQSVGRGLRKTDKKNTVLIIDFADQERRYLLEHFKARESTYKKMGWL